jgi:hypothetical protein
MELHAARETRIKGRTDRRFEINPPPQALAGLAGFSAWAGVPKSPARFFSRSR